MQKTRKVLHFCCSDGEFKVIEHYGKNNPYYLYQIYTGINEYGYTVKHSKLIVKYANLASCFYWFVQHDIGM